MENATNLKPTVVVIFGGGGDLTRRKLIPAWFNLYLDQNLPERFAIIGLDRAELEDDAFRQRLYEGVNQFSRRGPANAGDWQPFAARLSYLRADFTDQALYAKLAELLAKQDQDWNAKA
ncbi:MAG: glucose-6-phosphate dehydrogenase, partial [bacterium]